MENRPRRLSDHTTTVLALTLLSMTATAPAAETITVSEPGGVGVGQTNPLVIGTSEGAIVAFKDGRSGLREDRLRAIDHAGVPRGPSVLLEALAYPTLSTYELVLGANSSGDVVAVWGISGLGGRHAVLLDPLTAEPIGPEKVILGDEPGVNAESEVTIEVAPDGAVLVFFMANSEFRARMYNRDFDPLGPSFLVESSTGGNYVDTSFHANGEFTLAWTGVEVPYFSMVRSQRYGADGTALGPVFDLTSDADGVFIDTPAIAGRSDGTALVAWLKWDSGAGIWGQLLDETGAPEGQPSLLVEASAILGDPRDLYAKEDGTWALVQHLESEVGAASIEIFTPDMMSTGSETTLLETYRSEAAWMGATESILLVWETVTEGSAGNIDGAIVNTDRTSAGSPSTLSDDPDGADQVQVVMDGNADGRTVVVWTDKRNGPPQVFMQIFDEIGAPVGGNLYIAEMDAHFGTPSDVSMNASGEVLVGWQQQIDGEIALLMRRFAADGTPIGASIDVTSGSPDLYADFIISLLDDGRCLAVWNTMTQLPAPGFFEIDMFVRLYSPDGKPMTAEAMALNSAISEIRDYRPVGVIKNSDGSASVFGAFERWSSSDGADLADGAMFRMVASGGLPSGEEAVFLDSTSPLVEMTVAGDSAGFMVAWTDVAEEVIEVRTYNNESVEFSRDTISGAADARNPVALIGPDRTRFIGFDDRSTPIGVPQHAFNFQRYDVFGRRLGDPANVFTIGEEVDYSAYDRGPDAVVVGDRFIYGYSSASGTDQGYDVRMSWLDVEVFAPGDYNCDNRVNGVDLSKCLGFWGMSPADLTGDGTTNGLDLAIILGHWTG